MTTREIIHLRLHNQLIANQRLNAPEQVVSWLGAIQAQDFSGAKWSVGLRLSSKKESDIDLAIERRSMIRTWPMRGTLHFVAAEDARWMLQLLTPRIIAGSAGRHRQLNLTESVFERSSELLATAMEGGKQLIRSEVFSLLEEKGIATSDQRGMHIINYLAQKQIICHGIHNDKQPTYVLFNEWVPESRNLPEKEALAALTLRYFKSHGPATLHDFTWWTGLKISDAKEGLKMVSSRLHNTHADGITYWYDPELADLPKSGKSFLLPGFDEYMLGYTNRSLILEKSHAQKIIPGNNGVFMPTIVWNGKVVGTWRRVIKKDSVQIDLSPFEKISPSIKQSVEIQARKYGRYLDKTVSQITWL
jgi:hypothetical protein